MVTEQTTNSVGEAELSTSSGVERRAEPDLATPARLAAAREAAGLSASEVAGRLGMATRQIEALERGDWNALPGQAFVRAALRSYGKAVGVDVAPLLASLGGQVAAPVLKPSSTLESPIPRGGGFGFGTSSGVSGRLAWIVLGIGAVIAIIFYFGPGFQFGDDGNESERVALRANGASGAGNASQAGGAAGGPNAGATDATASPAGRPDGQAPASVGGAQASGTLAVPGNSAAGGLQPLAPLAPLAPPSAASASGADTSAAGSSSVPAAANGQVAQPAAGARASGVPATDTASGTSTLSLRFERESWVEIREAGGRVLLSGIQAAGSERSLAGRRPLSLVIGNAPHVRLERDGQPVDLAGRSRQGVARFTLE